MLQKYLLIIYLQYSSFKGHGLFLENIEDNGRSYATNAKRYHGKPESNKKVLEKYIMDSVLTDERKLLHHKHKLMRREVSKEKLHKVCDLLQNAIEALEVKDNKHFNDKAKKPDKKKDKSCPCMCLLGSMPCGCCPLPYGCLCPMCQVKVKYTPPKFKLKVMKAKVKCGHPLCGIHLGK